MLLCTYIAMVQKYDIICCALTLIGMREGTFHPLVPFGSYFVQGILKNLCIVDCTFKVWVFWEGHKIWKNLCHTLQMFAGIYGVFAGKSGCGDFKFAGIACYLQSLQSFLRKNNNRCRELMLQGYCRDSLHQL